VRVANDRTLIKGKRKYPKQKSANAGKEIKTQDHTLEVPRRLPL
jgi:hypothetical protein